VTKSSGISKADKETAPPFRQERSTSPANVVLPDCADLPSQEAESYTVRPNAEALTVKAKMIDDWEGDHSLACFYALFNPAYLIWQHPASESIGLEMAVSAYLAGQCRLESPLFSDEDYYRLHPDVLVSGMPALRHYALHGRLENRQPTPLFFPSEAVAYDDGRPAPGMVYLDFLSGTASQGWHCLIDGAWIRRDERFLSATNAEILQAVFHDQVRPHPLFDPDFYRSLCARDGVALKRSTLLHYITIGWKLGIDPHPLIDGQYYRVDQNSHIASSADIDTLSSFVLSDSQSQLMPSPMVDLMHLRHQMHLRGYEYQGDWRLLADAIETDWVSLHPHLERAMVQLIIDGYNPLKLAEPTVTVAQFCELVGMIRLGGHPPPASEGHSEQAPQVEDAKDAIPDISIVILNYNKPIFTIVSAYSAVTAIAGRYGEVFVVDNGSEPFLLEILYRYCGRLPGVRIISTKENRYFGEGNNLAVDLCSGAAILFLNNDAVINGNTVDRLLETLKERTEFGAVSPIMVLPDGQVQEVGGLISDCGQVIQHAKFMSLKDVLPSFDAGQIFARDYVSASCCLVRRDVMAKVLGFDLTFDPFYYEDTDLCARISAQGYKLGVHTAAFAVHRENASTREFLGESMLSVIGRQRQKFRNRWFSIYERITDPDVAQGSQRYQTAARYEVLTAREVEPGYSGRPTAWIYTPYDIRIGGGERYILALARVISDYFEVWLLTKQQISRARVAMTMDDLAIQPGRLHVATMEASARWLRPELFISMGNEIEPPVPACGRHNIYHCQFPFPVHQTGQFSMNRIAGYDAFLVNSRFTADNILRLLEIYGIGKCQVHVVYPPVALPSKVEQKKLLASKAKHQAELSVLNIGRFIALGHNKRQDVVLEVAEHAKRHDLPVHFELYGALSSDAQDVDWFTEQMKRARDVKAKIEANVSRAHLEAAMVRASLYIHPCGYGCYPGIYPERIEHFGITVVEAMGYGAIPLVYEWGGPAETVTACGVGETFSSAGEAYVKVEQETRMTSEARLNRMLTAMKASRRYGEDKFEEAVLNMLDMEFGRQIRVG